jgi:hypothetical protein
MGRSSLQLRGRGKNKTIVGKMQRREKKKKKKGLRKESTDPLNSFFGAKPISIFRCPEFCQMARHVIEQD